MRRGRAGAQRDGSPGPAARSRRRPSGGAAVCRRPLRGVQPGHRPRRDPLSGGQRPHLQVTATVETLFDPLRCSRRGLGSGALLAGDSARRFACDSTILQGATDVLDGEKPCWLGPWVPSVLGVEGARGGGGTVHAHIYPLNPSNCGTSDRTPAFGVRASALTCSPRDLGGAPGGVPRSVRDGDAAGGGAVDEPGRPAWPVPSRSSSVARVAAP